jgi:hypothetical protein
LYTPRHYNQTIIIGGPPRGYMFILDGEAISLKNVKKSYIVDSS